MLKDRVLNSKQTTRISQATQAQIAIRTMRVDDLPDVHLIECRAHMVPWSMGIFQDCLRVGYDAWLLTVDERITAFAIMSLAVAECHILNLCVDTKAQRQGYGRRLLSHLLDVAKSRETEYVFLEVRKSNEAALKLYQNFGFKIVGERKDYYKMPKRSAKRREDAIILALNLSDYEPIFDV